MARLKSEYDNCLSECIIGKALAGLSVGMLVTNPDGKVIWLNRTAETLLGVDMNQVLGKKIEQVIRDPRLACFWQEAQEEDGNLLGELTVQWPDDLDLKVNATPCRAPDGRIIGRAMLFCDVTSEKVARVELSNAVARRLLSMAGDPSPNIPPSRGLTSQELQIMRSVGQGLSNQGIAEEFGISLSTVRSHLKNIYRKLDLSSRSEAVSYAVRNQIL